VIERRGARRTTYALRFRAYNKRRSPTLPAGTTRALAGEERQNVLADVRRGRWQPLVVAPVAEEPRPMPTFYEFAG
jgi:hypothetical protein